ncbi:MAG TPA: LamB/YcsF family protein, partial [Chitinophagaceae bacterium]
MITAVDINCDIGEGTGTDEQIMPFISSANIACGYHAGSLDEMRKVIRRAVTKGVAIGAHPSFA